MRFAARAVSRTAEPGPNQCKKEGCADSEPLPLAGLKACATWLRCSRPCWCRQPLSLRAAGPSASTTCSRSTGSASPGSRPTAPPSSTQWRRRIAPETRASATSGSSRPPAAPRGSSPPAARTPAPAGRRTESASPSSRVATATTPSTRCRSRAANRPGSPASPAAPTTSSGRPTASGSRSRRRSTRTARTTRATRSARRRPTTARSRRTSPRPCSTATGRSGETASADTCSSSPWTAGRRRT